MRKRVCCLLNVSEGRSFKILEDIAAAATSVPGCAVLNIFADRQYNRSVITIAAEGSAIVPSVLAAAQRTYKRVTSLDGHVGGHPRLGLVDLAPFYPLGKDTSLEFCGERAKEFARRLTEEVTGASAFLFGTADAKGRSLVTRRKEFRWYSNEAESRPDLGEFSAQRGIVGVGASPYVTNFNITLTTESLEVGIDVAQRIRATSPDGVPGVEAMAFPHRGRIEVALNVNGQPKDIFEEQADIIEGFGGFWYASPNYIERRVRQFAAFHCVGIFGLRTVGFWPKEAEALAEEVIDVDPQVWLKRWYLKNM